MSGYQTEKQREELKNRHKLVVRVIEARGLKAADFGGTSDPFAELRIKNDNFSYKTRTIKKTLNPFWDEEFTLAINDLEKDILSVKIYDFDQTTNNDLIGELEFYVASFINQQPKEEWKQVMERKGPGQFKPSKGEIKLKISHVAPGGEQKQTQTQSPPPTQQQTQPQSPPPTQFQQPYPQQYPPQGFQQYPQQGFQQYPQQGFQQYPQQPYPQQGFPQQPYPQQGFPQQPYPQQGFPQQPFPQQGFPQQPYPQQGFPPPNQQYPPPGF